MSGAGAFDDLQVMADFVMREERRGYSTVVQKQNHCKYGYLSYSWGTKKRGIPSQVNQYQWGILSVPIVVCTLFSCSECSALNTAARDLVGKCMVQYQTLYPHIQACMATPNRLSRSRSSQLPQYRRLMLLFSESPTWASSGSLSQDGKAYQPP